MYYRGLRQCKERRKKTQLLCSLFVAQGSSDARRCGNVFRRCRIKNKIKYKVCVLTRVSFAQQKGSLEMDEHSKVSIGFFPKSLSCFFLK